MTLRIHTYVVSHFDQNARILFDDDSKKIMIIDPGASVDTLLDACMLPNYRIDTIFLTHCHIDHAGGVKKLLELCESRSIPKPKVAYHSKEIIMALSIEPYGSMYGFTTDDYQNAPHPDVLLDDCASLEFGNYMFPLFFTPGHSPGHVVLYINNPDVKFEGAYIPDTSFSGVLIAGDTLFNQSIGRTDLPMGDHDTLLTSIKTHLFTLPDDTIVCPGHGPTTIIGKEKQTNPFLN